VKRGSGGRNDNYGFALAAHPGESQGRPSTNPSSQLIDQHRPARPAYPQTPPSRTVAPYSPAAPPDPTADRLLGAGQRLPTFIPVTNPIESTFATVRLRTRVTKGPGSRAAGLAMAFKLIEAAEARWRAVNGPHLVALVRAGARFERGVLVEREAAA
jgi:hypothetical protein